MRRLRAIKVIRVVSTALVVVVAIGAAMLTVVIPRLTGSVSLTVLTGSMSPTIPAGSAILVQPLEPSEVREGDIITFQAKPGESTYVTHRVIEVETEDGQRFFITKGDANRGPDSDPVPAGAVRGRVIFHVPYAGRLAETVRSPMGALGLIGIPCTIYIVFQALDLRAQLRQRKGRATETATVRTATDVQADGGPARAILMASAHGGPVDRRELSLLASGFGGSVVHVQGDHIVVMVVAAPHVLDEVEVQLRLHHSCDVRRSNEVSFPGSDAPPMVEMPAVAPVANGAPFETVSLGQPVTSPAARLRRASEDLRRHASGVDRRITVDFSERAELVREEAMDRSVAVDQLDRRLVDV